MFLLALTKLRSLQLQVPFQGLSEEVKLQCATESGIADVVARSGPYPHDVLRALLHPEQAEIDMVSMLKRVDIEALFDMLGSMLYPEAPSPLIDALFVRRRDARFASLRYHDVDIIQFRNRLACKYLLTHIRHLGIDRIREEPNQRFFPVEPSAQFTSHLLGMAESTDTANCEICHVRLDWCQALASLHGSL